MVLKGEAKTRYMREYMRRRRAGQPAKPKPSAAYVVKLEARVRELEVALERERERHEAKLAQRGTADVGKFEARIRELEAEIKTLKERIADRQYFLSRAERAHARIQHALGRFRKGKGVGSAKAFRVIDLCLHPDTRGQVTDKQIHSAMTLWNWCREILTGKDEKKPAAKKAAPQREPSVEEMFERMLTADPNDPATGSKAYRSALRDLQRWASTARVADIRSSKGGKR